MAKQRIAPVASCEQCGGVVGFKTQQLVGKVVKTLYVCEKCYLAAYELGTLKDCVIAQPKLKIKVG